MASWEMGRMPHFIDETYRKPRQRLTHQSSSLHRSAGLLRTTYSGRDGGVHVDDTTDVGTYGVDGSVGAEPGGIRPQVGGSLLDHLPNDVELDLQREDSVTPPVKPSHAIIGGGKTAKLN